MRWRCSCEGRREGDLGGDPRGVLYIYELIKTLYCKPGEGQRQLLLRGWQLSVIKKYPQSDHVPLSDISAFVLPVLLQLPPSTVPTPRRILHSLYHSAHQLRSVREGIDDALGSLVGGTRGCGLGRLLVLLEALVPPKSPFKSVVDLESLSVSGRPPCDSSTGDVAACRRDLYVSRSCLIRSYSFMA